MRNRVTSPNRSARPIPRDEQLTPFQVMSSKEIHRIAGTPVRCLSKETQAFGWIHLCPRAVRDAHGRHVLGREVAASGRALKPTKPESRVLSHSFTAQERVANKVEGVG